MAAFFDQEEVRRRAQERLDARLGYDIDPAIRAARQRLDARKTDADSTRCDSPKMAAKIGPYDLAVSAWQGRSFSSRIMVMIIAGLVMTAFVVGVVSALAGAHPKAAVEEPSTNEAIIEREPTEEAPLVMPSYLDETLSKGLMNAAKENEDIAWIAAHVNDYAFDGPEVQTKVLTLALNEPAAVAFVKQFPQSYPATSAGIYDEKITKGVVPLLMQWDQRWGYLTYSSAPLGLSGCCPTAFSMVYMGLTGKTDMTPAAMAQKAETEGYMDQYEGTDGNFIVDSGTSLGLACNKIPVDLASLRIVLDAGEVVICNVGPGDFTSVGHFFVITGINNDGTVKINDPYSQVRSSKSWDINMILNQTIALYSCRVA